MDVVAALGMVVLAAWLVVMAAFTAVCAVAATALQPGIEVWGVEPEAGNDTQLSLARGEIVRIATPHTIADGAQTVASGQLTFPVIQSLVRGIVTVSDDQLVQTSG